jgi:phosphohistidine phosphatase SixA
VNDPRDPAPFRILLRHADAGIRSDSSEPDAWRALTPLGRLQANGVVGRLRSLPVMRVFTSPALRCRQTVVPLARSLSVDVEPRPELAITADPHRLAEFLRDRESESAVLCTHRETLAELFTLLTGRPGHGVEGAEPMTKAALWLIGHRAGAVTQPVIRYLSAGAPHA